MAASAEVKTIGHSTQSLPEFVQALQAHQVQLLVDIRRFPTSRRNPQYSAEELRKALFHAGLRYLYLGDELGGFRQAQPDSPHVGLKGCSFRAYADHLYTPLYEAGVRRLIEAAARARACVMCSERRPQDCHRKILSDDLALTRNLRISHILDAGPSRPHEPTSTARLVGGRVLYAPTGLRAFDERSSQDERRPA